LIADCRCTIPGDRGPVTDSLYTTIMNTIVDKWTRLRLEPRSTMCRNDLNCVWWAIVKLHSFAHSLSPVQLRDTCALDVRVVEGTASYMVVDKELGGFLVAEVLDGVCPQQVAHRTH